MQLANRTRRSALLFLIGIAEGATGLGLLIMPTVVATLLLGSGDLPPIAIVLARATGAALLCIGFAAWLSKNDERSPAQLGLIMGLLIYNGLAAAVFAHAAIGLDLAGILLWPACLAHRALAVWCAVAR